MRENKKGGLRDRTQRRLNDLKRAGHPVWFLKVVGNQYQRPNVPDFLVCWGGIMGAIELKRPGERPTPGQCYELQQIAAAHGHAFVATSMEEVDDCLARLRQAALAAAHAEPPLADGHPEVREKKEAAPRLPGIG